MGNKAADTTSALGGAAGIASAITPWAAPVLGVANIGMSLLEASKQADLQKSAERVAEQAFSEQKKIQGQNFFEALRAPMEQYNKQRQAITAGIAYRSTPPELTTNILSGNDVYETIGKFHSFHHLHSIL